MGSEGWCVDGAPPFNYLLPVAQKPGLVIWER